MAHLSSETTQHIARRSLTALIVALGLVALVFTDQSLHWLIENIPEHYEVPTAEGSGPGIWLLFSLFYTAATVFGFTILYRRSEAYGARRQGAVLGASWATAMGALWLVTLLMPETLTGGLSSANAPIETALFVVDQIARGAFFDLFETMGWAFTEVTHNPDAWWFSATLVIFRTMTSIGSVVLMVRVLGLRSQDVGLG